MQNLMITFAIKITINDKTIAENINGTEYCEGIGRCINGGYGNFRCECPSNKFWNVIKFK